MTEFLTILVGAALVNNLVLVQFLGVSSFFTASNKLTDAGTLGLLSAIVMLCSSMLNFTLYKLILEPLELQFLRLLVFVFISAFLANFTLNWVKKYFPRSFRRLHLAVFMVGGNSAVVGVSLLMIKSSMNWFETLAYSFGAAFGFALVLILFAALRQRLETTEVPLPFKGLAIDMISAGLVAMAFIGFAGIN